MNKHIKAFLLILFFISSSYSQNIWHTYPMDDESWHLVNGLSIDSVKTIILNNDINTPSIMYGAAVKYLFYYHRDTEGQFLLNNLNTEIDTSLSFPENLFLWNKIYIDTYVLGLLGDISMIDKMKIIADKAIGNPKSEAIRRLAEAGIYNHYEFVKNEFLDNSSVMYGLALYGRDERYRNEVKTLLTNKAYSSNTTLEVMGICSYLNYIPRAGTELLNDFFEIKSGNERYDYFRELGIIDKDGQPERSMFALVNENNDTLKAEYIPRPYRILELGWVSKKYVEPMFINFLANLNIPDINSFTNQMKEYFLWEYTPAKPDTTLSTNSLIDNLNDYVDSVLTYSWLGDITFSNDLKNILTTAKTILENGDSLACRVQVKAFRDLVDNVYKDSLNSDPRFVTIEGWKFLYWNAQYILDRLPEPQANPNLVVNLKNSLGNQIPASNVKYYEGSWKDAVNNGDGTFTVVTTRSTVSIRVFYEYASQQVDNVPAQNNTYTFTTVNAAVQLKNSLGNLIDTGTVQYYAGAWRSFGTTSNGVAYKELLPINYSFRMTYEYGSIDKQQNLSTDPIVIFQTVNAAVQLKNSLGNLIDLGTVQYYSGAWRSFGTTSNGVAYKELLPINYSFRMTYEFVSNDKQQNLNINPVVDFSTVLCSVKVSKTNNNEPINNAAVKYYSGAWRNLGTTNSDGITTKELLPANLSFRATSGTVSLDKQQDISVNSLVEILLNIP